MSDVERLLGVDFNDLVWQDLSVCAGVPTNKFYDDYESDAQTALVVDQMCLSCPVMSVCLSYGVENSEWGVWGGIYLSSGKKDLNKNSHKTESIWDEIRGRLHGE